MSLLPIPVVQSFTVNPAAQTIAFGALSNVVFGATPFALTATASSGRAVIFAPVTTPVCTVSGVTLAVIAAGTCSITASQPGNANYVAATPVSNSLTINPAGTDGLLRLPRQCVVWRRSFLRWSHIGRWTAIYAARFPCR